MLLIVLLLLLVSRGSYSAQVRLQCTAQSVADYTTFTEAGQGPESSDGNEVGMMMVMIMKSMQKSSVVAMVVMVMTGIPMALMLNGVHVVVDYSDNAGSCLRPSWPSSFVVLVLVVLVVESCYSLVLSLLQTFVQPSCHDHS